MEHTRDQLIRRAIKTRQEISLIFNTAEHWNRLHPDLPPLEPDPDGELSMCATAIDKMLDKEKVKPIGNR